MKNEKQRRILFWGYIFAAVFLFLYVAIRCHLLSFTHDESLSFTIINGNTQWFHTTNNHLLNTILGKYSTQLFGISEFSLRLPNLLSFVLFLFYGFLFFRKYAARIWPALIVFPIIFLNPLSLDFFGLFRGYGLALSFFMAGTFHFFKLLEKENNWDYLFGISWSILSIYSNYSFIVPTLSIWAAFGVFIFWKNKPKTPLKALSFLPFGIVALIPAALHITSLKSNKEIFFGGKQNALMDTIIPCFRLSFPDEHIWLLIWPIVISCLTMPLFGFIYFKKKELGFLSLSALSMLIAPSIAFYLFDINYAPGRAGTYWVLMFGLIVFFIAKYSWEKFDQLPARIFSYSSIFIGIAFLVNFFMNTNISHTILWKYDSHTKDALKILNQGIKKEKKYTVGCFWLYEPTLNFYRTTKNYDWLHPIKRENELGEKDFYYLGKENMDMVKTECLDTLHIFKNTETYILKNCGSE